MTSGPVPSPAAPSSSNTRRPPKPRNCPLHRRLGSRDPYAFRPLPRSEPVSETLTSVYRGMAVTHSIMIGHGLWEGDILLGRLEELEPYRGDDKQLERSHRHHDSRVLPLAQQHGPLHHRSGHQQPGPHHHQRHCALEQQPHRQSPPGGRAPAKPTTSGSPLPPPPPARRMWASSVWPPSPSTSAIVHR